MQQAVDVGMDHVWLRLQGLAALLREGLALIPGVTVQDHGRCLCAIVSFTKVPQTLNIIITLTALHVSCHRIVAVISFLEISAYII